MSCSKCGTSNTSCGCKDTPYTTAMPANCQPDSNCPTPSKCSEYMDASCVYLNDGIYDADLPAKTSVEEAIQQLTLMITNPECTHTSSCNCPGGGGGTYTADNGVYEETPNVFSLGSSTLGGSTFTTSRFINTQEFNLNLSGNIETGYVQTIINNSVAARTGGALFAQADQIGQKAIYAYSQDGMGIYTYSQTSRGLYSVTEGFENAKFENSYQNGTIVTPVVYIDRVNATSGGASFKTDLNSISASEIQTIWTTQDDEAAVKVKVKKSGSVLEDHLTLKGSGQEQLHKYGQGTFVDTPTYVLGVDASGNVIETTGGSTYTVTNGLTESPTNNFKLGGTLTEDTDILGDNNTYNLTLGALDNLIVAAASDVSLEATNKVKLQTKDFAVHTVANSRILNLNETLGQLTLDGYYASTGVLYTATPAYALGVDNTGNVLKVPFNTGATGDITADNGLTNNTTSNVRLGGPLIQSTQIGGGVTEGGPYDLSIGDPGSSDPVSTLTLHASVLALNTPEVTATTAVNNQVFTLIDQTTGEGEWKNPFTLTTTGAGAASYNITTGTLNIPTPPSATVYTVNNGLTASPTSSNFKLGGSLVETTTVNATATYKLILTGTRSVANEGVVEISNTSSASGNGTALRVNSTSTGLTDTLVSTTVGNAALRGEATLTGLYGVYGKISSAGGSGAAVYAEATNNSAGLWATNVSSSAPSIRAAKSPVGTISTVQSMLALSTTGITAAGAGNKIEFLLGSSTSGSPQVVNTIESSLSNAVLATKTSTFRVTGINNNATVTHLEITGAGIFRLSQGLSDYADDTAAAAGGIPVNGLYRTGSFVKIRVL